MSTVSGKNLVQMGVTEPNRASGACSCCWPACSSCPARAVSCTSSSGAQLSLVFGVTVYAVATVLAVFFGGLALGSFLAGRLVARRPDRCTGTASSRSRSARSRSDAGRAACVERLYVAFADVLPDSVPLLTAVRFVLSFAVLIVPATLLGASLPLVVSRRAVRGPFGERIGVLYATNTAGAIVGTLLAGFWMIGASASSSSFRIAAVANAVSA